MDSGIEMDTIVVDELLKFCEALIQSEVGLVLCQKVVHPRLKYRWRQAGVIVVDRLGLQPVAYVLKLTGNSALKIFSFYFHLYNILVPIFLYCILCSKINLTSIFITEKSANSAY